MRLKLYLWIAIVLTCLNMPLFIFSLHLNQPEQGDQAPAILSAPKQEIQSTLSSSKQPMSTDQSLVPLLGTEVVLTERYPRVENLYIPPLVGECKKLYQTFINKTSSSAIFKAFAYSYDGESAYCAGAESEKSQPIADEIALKDCREHLIQQEQPSIPCHLIQEEKE